jgi:hypothetical protein
MVAEHDAQIDDVERAQSQVAEVVVHSAPQVCGREGRVPRPVLTPPRA